jgi:hypothetical protein
LFLGWIKEILVTKDKKYLLAAYYQLKYIGVWNLETKNLVKKLEGHTSK